LLDICRRAAIFITKSKTSIKVDLQEESLSISINNPDVGSFSESISQDYFGNEHSFFFNFSFLQDVLRAVNTECVEMNFGHSKNSAVLITVPDRSDCKFVIMPMKTQ
jgi:DNA polymerase III sliding clamp (beta) subunit (PCNA family)